MSLVIKKLEETDYSYHELVELLHDSFKERLEQGLSFTSCTMSEETFVQKYSNGYIIVGFDDATKELLALYTVHIMIDKRGDSYGYLEQLAVSPKAKRSGVGTRMLNANLDLVKQAGGKYVLSDTSCGAKSSVNWHYKNGFQKYSYDSYRNTNYYSFVFIRPLVENYNIRLYFMLHFVRDYVLVKLKYKKNGMDTGLHKLVSKIRRIIYRKHYRNIEI